MPPTAVLAYVAHVRYCITFDSYTSESAARSGPSRCTALAGACEFQIERCTAATAEEEETRERAGFACGKSQQQQQDMEPTEVGRSTSVAAGSSVHRRSTVSISPTPSASHNNDVDPPTALPLSPSHCCVTRSDSCSPRAEAQCHRSDCVYFSTGVSSTAAVVEVFWNLMVVVVCAGLCILEVVMGR